MPSGQKVAVSATPVAPAAEFFIPDLCATRAVFLMVLLTELIVVVYTLALSALPGFDWQVLAMVSLFAQWVVLVSAALLCQLRGPLSRLSVQAAAICSLLLIMAITALTSAGAAWLYPLGLALAAVGFVRLAPTRRNLQRDQDELSTRGCPIPLVHALRQAAWDEPGGTTRGPIS